MEQSVEYMNAVMLRMCSHYCILMYTGLLDGNSMQRLWSYEIY